MDINGHDAKGTRPISINPSHQLVIVMPLVELGLGYDSTCPVKASAVPTV